MRVFRNWLLRLFLIGSLVMVVAVSAMEFAFDVWGKAGGMAVSFVCGASYINVLALFHGWICEHHDDCTEQKRGGGNAGAAQRG